MHLNSELMFRHHAGDLFTASTEVLEIGPDATPSTLSVGTPHARWDTTDLAIAADAGFVGNDPSALTFQMTDPLKIPAADNSYDAVVAANVIEHTTRPFEWVAEAGRVVRPGGHLVIVCPISWPEHRAPYDCWRIYPDGMRALFEAAELATITAVVDRVEPTTSRRWYPGTSTLWGWDQDRHLALQRQPTVKERIMRLIGWPLPAAVDCVGVARKPTILAREHR